MLTPVQQRILGVLIEKELTVPDTYPLTEAALLAGCNQKSNRDPEMSLESHELNQALIGLRELDWVTRIDTSARSTRYRHGVDTMLGLDLGQKSVLCELLIRGPQAPGALKPRVARMGFQSDPQAIRDVLVSLRDRRGQALVEEQPRRPRERDQRWAHCLGDAAAAAATASADSGLADRLEAEARDTSDPTPHPTDVLVPASARSSTPSGAPSGGPAHDPEKEALVDRVEELERIVAMLRADIDQFKGLLGS